MENTKKDTQIDTKESLFLAGNSTLGEVHLSWQSQYLVTFKRHFSWQAQYLVKFKCHFS